MCIRGGQLHPRFWFVMGLVVDLCMQMIAIVNGNVDVAVLRMGGKALSCS